MVKMILKRSTMSNLPLPHVVKSRTPFEGFVSLQCDTLRLPNASLYEYYTVKTYPKAVSILAKTSDGDYLITEEYRHPIGRYIWGCPGGFLEHEEDPLVGAQRELLEETGYTAEHLNVIGTSYPLPGLLAQQIFFVLASNVKKVADPDLEESEMLSVRLESKETIEKMMRQGTALDGTFLSALLFEGLG